jgi:hypothetical protein
MYKMNFANNSTEKQLEALLCCLTPEKRYLFSLFGTPMNSGSGLYGGQLLSVSTSGYFPFFSTIVLFFVSDKFPLYLVPFLLIPSHIPLSLLPFPISLSNDIGYNPPGGGGVFSNIYTRDQICFGFHVFFVPLLSFGDQPNGTVPGSNPELLQGALPLSHLSSVLSFLLFLHVIAIRLM